jgi:hypothetical protein
MAVAGFASEREGGVEADNVKRIKPRSGKAIRDFTGGILPSWILRTGKSIASDAQLGMLHVEIDGSAALLTGPASMESQMGKPAIRRREQQRRSCNYHDEENVPKEVHWKIAKIEHLISTFPCSQKKN